MGRRNPEAAFSKLYSKRRLAALTTGAILLAGCSEKGGEEQSPTAASEVTQSPEQVNPPEHSYESLTDEQKFIDAGLELPSIEQWSDRKQRLFTYYLTQDVASSGAYQKPFEYIDIDSGETVLDESYVPPEALLGNENNTDQEIIDSLNVRIFVAAIVAKEGNGYRDGEVDSSDGYNENSAAIGKKILGGLVAHEVEPDGSPEEYRDILSKSLDLRFDPTCNVSIIASEKMFGSDNPDITAKGSNNDPFMDQGEALDSAEDDTPIVWRSLSTQIDYFDGYDRFDKRLVVGLYPVIDDDGNKLGEMWLIVPREATLNRQ